VFKLIGRLIGVAIIAAMAFLALSLWHGGKPFRWLGTRFEQAGEVAGEKSNKLAEAADKIKKTTENFRDTKKKVTEDIRKVKEKIEYIAKSREDK
jgi:gas vesicle protein